MRKRLAVVGLVVALLAVAGVVGASASHGGKSSVNKYGIDSALPPVHIGLIAIQLPAIDLGRLFNIGGDAAAYYINHHGGFGGRKLILDKCNSMVSPAVMLTCTHQILGKHPLAEYGCDVVTSASGALTLMGQAGVPSFSCTNTKADFTYRWSFGLHPGATGEQAGWAKFVCTMKNVHRTVLFGQDQPEQRRDSTAAIQPVVQGCGKTFDAVYSPVVPTDYTPYVQQALSKKPDFVFLSQSAPQTASIAKLFQQNGFSADRLIVLDSSSSWKTTLALAGSAMNGTYICSGWKPWDDTEDPEIKTFVQSVKAVSSEDTRNNAIEYGYGHLMAIWTGAKAVGFAKVTPKNGSVNGAKLAQFFRTRSNLHLPITHSLINPGPKAAPQVKQPYCQIQQYKGGKWHIIPTGTKKDGWINGF
jgi:ABC-type branched-subunit amino acid transport system substrate-binding protein